MKLTRVLFFVASLWLALAVAAAAAATAAAAAASDDAATAEQLPKVADLDAEPERHWGVYRPQVYFGERHSAFENSFH